MNKKVVQQVQAAPAVQCLLNIQKKAKSIKKENAKRKIFGSITNSFDNLKESIASADTFISELLPQNCRFYKMGQKVGSFIIEQYPMRRTLSVRIKGKDTTRNVPFPYFYFLISFIKNNENYTIIACGVGARKSPLTSIEDEISPFPLCHVTGIEQVCMPLSRTSFLSIKDMADECVETFFGSRFVYTFLSLDKKIKSWDAWAKLEVPDMLKLSQKKCIKVKDLLSRYDFWDDAPTDFQAIAKTQKHINQILDQILDQFLE